MQNKIILTGLAVVLFIVSAVGGYYGPKWLYQYRQARMVESFKPGAVPEKIVRTFGSQFQNVLTAIEPKTLPEDSFSSLDRKSMSIADFAGKPVLVNMWATWCAPCVVELPSLMKLKDYYEGRLNVIGIALEPGRDVKDIGDFLEKRQLGTFAGYLDAKGDFGKNLGIRGLPTSFLIGSDGVILYRFEGDADWTSEASRAFFDAFLLTNP